MTDQSSNPFLNLLGSEPPVTAVASGHNDDRDSSLPVSDEIRRVSEAVGRVAQDVFCLAFSKTPTESKATEPLVFMEEVATMVGSKPLDLDAVKLALFERILMETPGDYLVTPKGKTVVRPSTHAVQNECILYLYECYLRLHSMNDSEFKDLTVNIKHFKDLVVQNTSTVLRQPALFENQDVHKQVVKLYEFEDSLSGALTEFIKEVASLIVNDEGKQTLYDAFKPILQHVHKDFADATVLTFPRSHFSLLSSFATGTDLADVIMTYTAPSSFSYGISYANTLFGAMLNLSCLPKTVDGLFVYFEKPLDGALSALEGNLWSGMSELCERIHGLISQILRLSPDLRNRVLSWIGGCLDANTPKGSVWVTTSMGMLAMGYISDGFSLNLTSVLLRLSQPFVSDKRKLLKIDPTYPSFKVELAEDMVKFGMHCRSLNSETCLQPLDDGEVRPFSLQPFSFITECFFMTHRAIDLGIRVVHERTHQLYQEIGRLQIALSEAQSRGQGRVELVETLRERMEMEMAKYLCMRCALLEPSMLKLLAQFEVATATWLIQVILDPVQERRENYAPTAFRELHLPLPEGGPPTLKCIPELIVESVGRFMKLAETYSPQTLEEGGLELMEPLLSLLLVLMGCKKRARNPHLRALLAESLGCLLPVDQDQPSLNPNPLGTFYREKLFVEHPHRDQIVCCLLNVFVSIEMTGEAVQFEQRFNYRRPMYTVMDYLWGIEEHRAQFKALAAEGERNMEEVTPPLFLRFLNLLMNDAIFLLDEALANMTQLRTLQTARSNGEWDNLPPEERERNEQYFRQIGMTARFDNILGKETIHTLEYMSSEIKSILCHRTMVDRIAAMLNYFLYHLVGPKKKNLKVKDHMEYKFDPASIVKDICRIYVHLGTSSEFCAAVSRDGRSYSPQLFTLAKAVLARISGGDLIVELETVAVEVERLAALQQTDEELLAEAPEEFLDPIMSTLMSDPVTLPSSRINIDRATIARHLLSDQTDPFNRSPLTMNMVKSNEELKNRIEEWIAERKRQARNSSADT